MEASAQSADYFNQPFPVFQKILKTVHDCRDSTKR